MTGGAVVGVGLFSVDGFDTGGVGPLSVDESGGLVSVTGRSFVGVGLLDFSVVAAAGESAGVSRFPFGGLVAVVALGSLMIVEGVSETVRSQILISEPESMAEGSVTFCTWMASHSSKDTQWSLSSKITWWRRGLGVCSYMRHSRQNNMPRCPMAAGQVAQYDIAHFSSQRLHAFIVLRT